MKNGLKIIAFCFLILVTTSCKKNENAYVHGQAIENDTGNPVSGISVTLVHRYKDENGAVQGEEIAITSTDANGKYRIDYHHKMFEDYFIFWRNEYKEYLPIAGDEYLYHSKTAKTIALTPVGYVKIRLKKNGFSNSYATVSPNSPDKNNLPVVKKSVPFDTLFPQTFRMSSGHQTYIIWYLFPNGNSDYISNTDLFTVGRGDTVIRTIQFD